MVPFPDENRHNADVDSDDSSAGGNDSTSGQSSSHLATSDETTQKGLSQRESQAVLRLRISVIVVMLLTSAAVSYVVYAMTSNAEDEEFESQYEGVASKVMASFEDIIHKMGAVSGLGVAMTAHSQDHDGNGEGWPFVTLSNFQQRAGNARALSGALMLSVAPLVNKEDFYAWNAYANGPHSSWIDDGYAFQEQQGLNDFEVKANYEESRLTDLKVDPMHYFGKGGLPVLEYPPIRKGIYLPIWQTSPVMKRSIVNENMLRRTNVSIPQSEVAEIVLEKEAAMLGGFISSPPGGAEDPNPTTSTFAVLRSIVEGHEVGYLGDPMANFYFPIFDKFNSTTRKAVAIGQAVVHWRSYFRKILPNNIHGIIVVLDNSCDGYFTYELSGNEALVIGFGDHHDRDYQKWERSTIIHAVTIDDGTAEGMNLHHDGCEYTIHVYPSDTFNNLFHSSTPLVVTLCIVAVLIFSTFVFLFYDRLVERRQKIVLAKATQSTAIIASIFPKNVRDKLLEAESAGLGTKNRLKHFLTEGEDGQTAANDPIADLFPHCTILFADISGFSSWSSSREPAQVFVLLETLYSCFDALAKRRKVFKVETIGDSYMAATGLPEPQEDHAIRMVRFAWDCIVKINHVTKELECSLGPDTGELSIRCGMHSGPVTAGVLRGDRARFQVFGDTVNVANRMESTGIQRKIQISSTTAQILRDAGKEHWLKPREDCQAFGNKGIINSFWVNPGKKRTSLASGGSTNTSEQGTLVSEQEAGLKTASQRLINWVTDMLLDGMKKIIHARNQCEIKECKDAKEVTYHMPEGKTCMDEVQTEIKMPSFNSKTAKDKADYRDVEINKTVAEALQQYVAIIASMYKKNPFHNFEHACHVTMSVNKLLKRVVAPELTAEELEDFQKRGGVDLALHIHDYTHGINSDPLTMFAMTFSALIHDVDHRGVSNMQLAVEEPNMANMYRNKSIAEQNSLDVAWEILMEDRFNSLRRTLFTSKDEMLRFRQLIVNIVLATDIFDKELNDLRKSRWARAFAGERGASNDADLRATIVLEHIIQASDVSHTMQHWHVYQKWNKKLFTELYKAFQEGRMGKDPSTFWYQGEIGFFDNYIIPLARKLKECGVFGVSSDEYLNYAVQNRAEWEERGEEIVKGFTQELVASFSEKETKLEKMLSTSEKNQQNPKKA